MTSYKIYEILNLRLETRKRMRGNTLEDIKNTSTSKKRKSIQFLITIIALLLLTTMVGCPFYRIFKIPCPCCGVTRAWIALVCGDIELAFAYHGLFLLIPIIGMLYIVRDRANIKHRRWVDIPLYLMVAAVFVYAILRWSGYIVMP